MITYTRVFTGKCASEMSGWIDIGGESRREMGHGPLENVREPLFNSEFAPKSRCRPDTAENKQF